MIDEETSLPVPQAIASQHGGVAQAIAAIIAISRCEWLSPVNGPLVSCDAAVNRARIAHPLIRFALDAKRAEAWRARAERQGRLQSVESVADPKSANL